MSRRVPSSNNLRSVPVKTQDEQTLDGESLQKVLITRVENNNESTTNELSLTLRSFPVLFEMSNLLNTGMTSTLP